MEDRLCLDKLVFAVTLRCNLRCKHCCPKVPYLKEPWAPSLEELTHSIDSAFRVVDEVERLEFSGGEPLLRPDLAQLVEYCMKYADRVHQYIRIITNGTIVPGDELMRVCCKHRDKVNFMVDDYGKSVSGRISQIAEVLSANRIDHEIRNYTGENSHMGGWVDVHIDAGRRNDASRAAGLYRKCNYVNSLAYGCTIVKGRLYACKQSMLVTMAGWEPDDPADYVDFTDLAKSKAELGEALRNLYKRDYLTACQYCDGFFDDSPRLTPGIQLTQEELKAAFKF